MIIPLSTDLRLGKQPWVTWVVISLCVIMFGLQVESNIKYELSVSTYCNLINKNKHKSINDLLSHDVDACTYLLSSYHILHERDIDLEEIESGLREQLEIVPHIDSDKMLDSLRKHHDRFSQYAPEMLDEKIMYFPQSYNPLTMLTSSIAHAGVFHIAFNLIFFFAFSPAVELLIGSSRRYSLTLISIAIGCSLFYSLFALSEGNNIPSLGLSGVVMGVIGLSAYLMPRARINTLIWLVVPIAKIPIPAWFMALWFIGFDAWDLLSEGMNQGVNLVAHVSGGVLGFLIGRLFFKKRKGEVQEELSEEIAYMKSQRGSAMSMNQMASTYKNMRILEEQHAEDMARKSRMAYEDRLFTMIRTDQSSEAVSLILADADPLYLQPLHYEDTFKQIGEWKKHRAYLCMGRLLIDLYSQQRRYADVFRVLKECLQVTPEFVLANPRDVLMLAQEANRQQLYKLAYALLHKVEERYTESVGYLPCGFLEVDILSNRLNKPELAIKRLQQLKKIANPVELDNINALQADLMK